MGEVGLAWWYDDVDASIDASDSLRAHLAAVLVTLGEDPKVVREKLGPCEVEEEKELIKEEEGMPEVGPCRWC